MTTLNQIFEAYVSTMDAKERAATAKAFAYMAWHTLWRRKVIDALPNHLEPVDYFHSFADRFDNLELIGFRPVIKAPKRA